jgi:hypothetical protein
MRSICLFLGSVLTLAALSCESTPNRQAGGNAFGDSYISGRLDSGNPNPEGTVDRDGNPQAPSYGQWRDSQWRDGD